MGQTKRVRKDLETVHVDNNGVTWYLWLACPYCGQPIVPATEVIGAQWSDCKTCFECGEIVAVGEASMAWLDEQD